MCYLKGTMSRKVLLIFPFLLLILHSPTAWSQGPEELLKVGAGAFEDGFWTVAETEWRRFLRLYPNHPKAPLVRYLLGRTLIEEGKVEEALRNLEAVKGVKGVDPAALHYWMAFCLGRLDRWKEAEVHLLRSLKASPKGDLAPNVLYLLGEAKYRRRRWEEAIPYLKRALKSLKGEPLLSRARLLLAHCLYRGGKFTEALRYLDGVREKNLREEALFWRGEVLFKAGRLREAVRSFDRFRRLYPSSGRLPEARYKLAYALYRLKEGQRARVLLEGWLRDYPDHPLAEEAQLLLARILMQGRNFKEAVAVLGEISKKGGPGAREAHYRLIWCYLQMGELETAKKLLGKYEDDISHYLRAEASLWEGNCKEALPYLFELMNKKPYRKKALLEIARCCYLAGKYQDCIANLDILKLEFPDFEGIDELLWLKAECLRGAGEEKEAAKLYTKILEKHKGSARAPWALYRLFNRAVEGGKVKEAETYFERLQRRFPDHELTARAALVLGRTLASMGRYGEALPKLEVASRSPIREIRGRALCWLGKAYLRLGLPDKALAWYEEAAEEGGEVAVLAYVGIGNVKAEFGDPEEARKAYEKALKLTKEERLKARIKELMELVEGKAAE